MTTDDHRWRPPRRLEQMDAEAFVEAQAASLLTLDGDGPGHGFGLPPFFGEGAGAGEDAYDYGRRR
jgi:hypothetical protein